VPANGDDIVPEKEMSIISTTVRAFRSASSNADGKRHTQTPQSRLRRLVSNIELLTAAGRRYFGRHKQLWCSNQPARRHICAARNESGCCCRWRPKYRRPAARQQLDVGHQSPHRDCGVWVWRFPVSNCLMRSEMRERLS